MTWGSITCPTCGLFVSGGAHKVSQQNGSREKYRVLHARKPVRKSSCSPVPYVRCHGFAVKDKQIPGGAKSSVSTSLFWGAVSSGAWGEPREATFVRDIMANQYRGFIAVTGLPLWGPSHRDPTNETCGLDSRLLTGIACSSTSVL